MRCGSHQQGQSGNDRHDGGDGKSQSVGDDTKDQRQESGSASDLDEREYEAISLGARIQPYQQAGQRLTTMRTDPTLDKLPLKLSLRNLSASSGMMSLVLVASDDVSKKASSLSGRSPSTSTHWMKNFIGVSLKMVSNGWNSTGNLVELQTPPSLAYPHELRTPHRYS